MAFLYKLLCCCWRITRWNYRRSQCSGWGKQMRLQSFAEQKGSNNSMWIRFQIFHHPWICQQWKGQNWGLLAQSSAGGVSHICNMSLGGLRLHSEVIEVEQHGGGTKRASSSGLSAWRLHVLSMPAWLISAGARASAHAPMWTACATTVGQPWLGGSGTYHKMEESTQQRKARIINITTTLSLGLDISECF